MKEINNILIIHTPLAKGKAEVLLVDLTKVFQEKGYKISFLNLSNAPELKEKFPNKNNLEFSNLTSVSFDFTPSKLEYLKLLIKCVLKIFNRRIKEIYKKSDVVWANAFPASFLTVLLKFLYGKNKKIFIYTHHFIKKKESKIIRFFYEKIMNHFDKIIGVSEEVAISLRETFFHIKDKIISIPNGINIKRFQIEENKKVLREKLNLPRDAFLGIYVGRFTQHKNQKFLLKMLKKIDDKFVKIITIGQGEMMEEFLGEMKNLKLEHQIINLGYIPNEIIPLYLKASDAFFCPSQKEGLSVSIIEALCAGLPVVIFKNVYSPEFKDAVLVAQNEEEFIKLAQLLINDEKLREEFKNKSLDISKEFDITHTAELYERCFK